MDELELKRHEHVGRQSGRVDDGDGDARGGGACGDSAPRAAPELMELLEEGLYR